jgi:uncharacterized protein (TIGR02996 family)
MTDEVAFLAAIADRPGDQTPRLVYADWLDDRGDPRAELVRIEEEQRTLPADGDRYWALKPRRDELRAGCSADWLAALGYGTVYRPVLAPWPTAGVKGRFRLLRELVERWYGVPIPDAGGRADEVAAVEARLGRTLPAAVREWIAFALDTRDRPPARNILRDGFGPDEVVLREDVGAVSLLMQAEQDIIWGVRDADWTADDPPVTVYYLNYGDEDDFDGEDGPQGAFVENHRIDGVAAFALSYATSYTRGSAGGFGVSAPSTAAFRRQLVSYFTNVVTVAGVEVYERDDMLVRYYPQDESGEGHLSVEVRRPVPRESVPGFLLALTRNGGSFHGMFTPDRR